MNSPIIRRAIEALDRFGVLTIQQAQSLLRMWRYHDQLSKDDVSIILSYYPDYEIPEQHYHREDVETGEPLPDGVDGFSIGRHASE